MSAEIPTSQSELPDSSTQASDPAQSVDGQSARVVQSGVAPEGGLVQFQLAAFADHLKRSGVRFLPAAGEPEVAVLADQFAKPTSPQAPSADPIEAATQASAATQAPNQPASTAPTTARPQQETAQQETAQQETAQQETVQRKTPPASPAAGSALPEIGIAGSYTEPSMAAENRIEILHQLSGAVAACQRCSVLAKCRKHTVFGDGNPTPRFVFLGEAPGQDEDHAGLPFVGPAGQLLTKMIQACRLSREDVYLLNTIKCRPPQNRNPSATEIEQCSEYLQTQLNVLQPEYIVCLGLIAAQSLLNSELSVGKMRGRLHSYHSSKVLVTYHPAYLLRNTGAKKAAWDDLQLMLRDAGMM